MPRDKAIIICETGGWPSYKDHYVVLHPHPTEWTMEELGRFETSREAMECRNKYNEWK